MQYDFFEWFFPQEECFGKNYSSFLDFTRNYERTSGILFNPDSKGHMISIGN